MELEFRQVQIAYLHCVLYENTAQEVQGEAIVPDTMGDMERIVGCCASAVLRSRQCQDGALSLGGDVQACVLYQAAGQDGPQAISVYFPFSLRRSVPTEACRLALTCRVQRPGSDAQLP